MFMCMFLLIGCAFGWSNYRYLTSDEYPQVCKRAKNMRQVDISLIESTGGKLIGIVYAGGDADPVDAARELATKNGGTHYVYMGHNIIDEGKSVNCVTTKSQFFGTDVIHSKCAEHNDRDIAYKYNIYFVPPENWNTLPARLQPTK